MKTRFSISLDAPLAERLDWLVGHFRYRTRSQFLSELVRERLAASEWRLGQRAVVGTLCLVYRHGHREVMERLAELQHQEHASVVSSLHVHLDRERCLEVLVLRGRGGDVQRLAERLRTTRGVERGNLVASEVLSANSRNSHSHSRPVRAVNPSTRSRSSIGTSLRVKRR